MVSQSCEKLQTFARGRVGRGRASLWPAPTVRQTAVKFPDFEELYLSSLVLNKSLSKLGNFTHFKTFFPVVSSACPCQKLK